MKQKIKVKIFFYSLVILPVLSLIIFEYYTGDCDGAMSHFIKLECSGVVVDKYIDGENHNYETIVLDNNNKFILPARRGIYNEIDIGDSIFKQGFNRTMMLYKEGGEVKRFTEEEPDCEYLLD